MSYSHREPHKLHIDTCMYVYMHTLWFRMLLIKGSKYFITLWIPHVTGDDIFLKQCLNFGMPRFRRLKRASIFRGHILHCSRFQVHTEKHRALKSRKIRGTNGLISLSSFFFHLRLLYQSCK